MKRIFNFEILGWASTLTWLIFRPMIHTFMWENIFSARGALMSAYFHLTLLTGFLVDGIIITIIWNISPDKFGQFHQDY